MGGAAAIAHVMPGYYWAASKRFFYTNGPFYTLLLRGSCTATISSLCITYTRMGWVAAVTNLRFFFLLNAMMDKEGARP
jgi:hypothetical protein